MRFPLIVRIIIAPIKIVLICIWAFPAILMIIAGEESLATRQMDWLMDFGN